jgi:hypothetical protein
MGGLLMGAYSNDLSNEEREKLERLEEVISLVVDLKQSHQGQDWHTMTICPFCHSIMDMWYDANTNIAWLQCAT